MGNNLAYELEEEEEDVVDDNELTLHISPEMLGEHITNALGSMMSELVGSLHPPTTNMPVIRKKPDLRTFRHTMLYKEIKALCGLPANCKRPCERWSLARAIQKRENGLATHPSGTFTTNQQRRIANLFVPNKKEERLMSLESKVFVCKFNKDGSRLITACQDAFIRIFDSSKGTYHRINRMKAKDVNWSILDIDFSPCGKYFAYSTWSDYFFVVPVDGTAEEVQWLDLNTNQNRCAIFSLRFSPCGRSIIGGCSNSCIYICDRETHNVKTIHTLRNFKEDINALSYVSDMDPNVFVSGCNSGIIKLWDTRCLGGNSNGNGSGSGSGSGSSGGSSNSRSKNTPVSVFMGHMDGITYIDPRNDGNYILSNSKDQSIKIWDLRTPTPSNKVNKHQLPILDWDYRWDNVPREYYNPRAPLDGDMSIMTYRGHRVTKSLLRAKFSPAQQTGQRYIYTGCGTGRIIIYDVLTGQIKEAIEGHKDIVRDLSWHPVRSEIISGSFDSHVNLNIFKRHLLLKRSNSDRYDGVRPLRRSRRIAHQNGEMDDDDEDDDDSSLWQQR